MVTIALKPVPDKARTVTHRREEITLAHYTVLADGVAIGRVFRDMATRERRTPGKRYVNARWQSPAWYSQRTDDFRRGPDYPSRREALTQLLRNTIASDYVEARNLSGTAKVLKP